MANQRVTDAVLPANFADGQILYGADLNQIISILKAGVNANKVDLDKIVTGDTSAFVVYSYGALIGLLDTETLVEGQYAIYYYPESAGDGIRLYTYSASLDTWVYEREISLIGIYEIVDNLEGTINAKRQIYLSTDDLTDIATGDFLVDIDID